MRVRFPWLHGTAQMGRRDRGAHSASARFVQQPPRGAARPAGRGSGPRGGSHPGAAPLPRLAPAKATSAASATRISQGPATEEEGPAGRADRLLAERAHGQPRCTQIPQTVSENLEIAIFNFFINIYATYCKYISTKFVLIVRICLGKSVLFVQSFRLREVRK